ncbi:putative oxidoreductase [Stanieria sp. NIES-3757]|nr:putative oxidoreductase [Stanieria sp. NIES-3757]
MQINKRRLTSEDILGQKLDYPASQREITPQPDSDLSDYSPANKLLGKVAIIPGGDSGIEQIVAIALRLALGETATQGADFSLMLWKVQKLLFLITKIRNAS